MVKLASERDINVKLRMHCKFCSNSSKSFDKIMKPKKVMMLKEHHNNEAEIMRKILE